MKASLASTIPLSSQSAFFRPSDSMGYFLLFTEYWSTITISDTAYFGPKMVGRITNSTNEDEDGIIYVVAILYNNNNVPIGVLTDMLYDDFPKGTKMGFEATTLSLPDYVTASSIGNYTIYAYPLQYQF